MKQRSIGLVAFWLGVAFIFVGSWLVMWWIAPFWRSTPPASLDGTAWAFGGLVFMLISLSVPVGIILLVIGMLLCTDEKGLGWPFALITAVTVLAATSSLVLPTLGYYPWLFGLSGGLILVFFFAAVWFWGKRRQRLRGPSRLAADYMLVSWVFFLMTAITSCALLGNPYGGLFFAERVLADNSMPWYYSMGTKVALYLALGMFFAFLSQYVGNKANAEPLPHPPE